MKKEPQSPRTARSPASITIRGVDPVLRAALDAEARRLGISRNALIIQTLSGSLGLAGTTRLFQELDGLLDCLSYEDAAELDAARMLLEEIDLSRWEKPADEG
jgi:hypothetical protein